MVTLAALTRDARTVDSLQRTAESGFYCDFKENRSRHPLFAIVW